MAFQNLGLNTQNQLKAVDNIPKGKAVVAATFATWGSIVCLLAVALLLRATVVEAFKIPSSSMVPTLEIGDHILVNKLSYGFRLPFVTKTVFSYSNPERGDVVVFTQPDDPATPETDESETNVIKRVIGLPGDTIEVAGTKVYVNQRLLDEPYSRWIQGGIKDLPPIKVPEGRVLLLGDNRDHSKDSRYWNNPFLEIDRIKGRAFIVYWNSDFRFNRIFHAIN